MVAVKYKYPNENEVIIEGADSYELKKEFINVKQWQASGIVQDAQDGRVLRFVTDLLTSNTGSIQLQDSYQGYHSLRVGEHWCFIGADGKSFNLRATAIPIETPTSELYQENGNTSLSVRPFPFRHFFTDDPTQLYLVDNLSYIPKWRKGLTVYTYSPFPFYGDPPLLIDCVVATPTIDYWHPARADTQWTLKIFEQGQQVFIRVSSAPPIYVQIISELSCPPNTCPVLCGNQVCCYGSDGIAVSSYQY